ncbi:alpha/beta fold hydrolase [Cytobacillus sp. FSL R7-0680]|uniref:alpha/beta fold hydrolase n=1 Tax=Cytobacillus sp. FSL R7-0680 TaxID=2921689 RepID=UPI0030F6AEA0
MPNDKMLLNGNDFYYEYYPHPTPKQSFVLLHGFLSSSFSFRKLIPLLQKENTVLTIDLPPFGKSGKAKKFIYSYENIASTIILLLEKLSIQQIVMVGHSMGGQICLNIAHQRPDLLEAVVLLCSSSYLPKMPAKYVYASHLPFFSHFVKRYLEKSGVEKNLNNVVYEKEMIDDAMRDGYLEPFLNKDIFYSLARMIRDREGDLDETLLKTINTPCLLIWGEADKVVPLSIGQRLQGDLPHSELHILKQAGHLIPEEKPEEIVAIIEQYLQKKGMVG